MTTDPADITTWHDHDPDYVQGRLEDAREDIADSFGVEVPWDRHRISMLVNEFDDLCTWSLVAGGVSQEVWWALDGAAGALRAQFALASVAAGQQLRFTIGGHNITVESTGPGNQYTAAPDWLNALWIGLVARDVPLLTVLRDFPVESMTAAEDDGVMFDSYQLEWAKAWQMLLRGERGDPVADQIAAAMELTDPEHATVAGAEWVLQIAFPAQRLLWDLTSGNRDGFPADVRDALTGSKEYWTRPIENRVRTGIGFVPWQIMGPVCAAIDSGFDIDIESQYLPAPLLYDRKDRAMTDTDPAADADLADAQYQIALAMYAAVSTIPGWSTTLLDARIDNGIVANHTVECFAGTIDQAPIATTSLTPNGIATIQHLYNTGRLLGLDWTTVTIWLHANDGTTDLSYDEGI